VARRLPHLRPVRGVVKVTHWVEFQQGPQGQRFKCACGWATEWTQYHDPHAGPAAVRHVAREEARMQLAG
jgi:hypothetical protein